MKKLFFIPVLAVILTAGCAVIPGGPSGSNSSSASSSPSQVIYPNYILEITYCSPGPDGTWFTTDDIALEYQIYFNNNQDNILYSTGPDHIPFTSDDYIEGYWTNIGGYSGKWCNGPGPDGIWFTADDHVEHAERWDIKPNLIYSNQGSDGTWLTGDDIQSGYYQDTLDAYGDITKRIRYGGKGLDNTWQTADDTLGQDWFGTYWKADYDGDKQGIYWAWTHYSSYDSNDNLREFRLHVFSAGSKFYTREYLFTNAGPDGVMFTGDDPLAYYKIAIKYDSFPTNLNDSSANVDPANIGDLEVSGVPDGSHPFTNSRVFGFSQIGNSQEDPQVFTLCPDVNMRAWQKWDIWGTNTSDYSQAYINKCRSSNILFIAGGTMSIVFRDEAANDAQFQDWATRDAGGNLMEHAGISPGAYRGSMANPSFRAHVLEYLKKQIDLGVDGLFLDELDGGYYGNEGYDDYFIRDFNRYLMNKYPGYTRNDWIQNFGMTSNNVIRRDIPYSDLYGNFNYRKYLEQKGWNGNPGTAANPLAPEWGYPVANRFDIHDTSFTGKYVGLYIKDIMVSLRKYARDKYSRELLITANGIFPWMDFNSLGMYDGDHDDYGMVNADYVPVQGGHLNGSKSLKTVYLKMLAKSRDVSGNVPLVLFMDWPNIMINGYYNLSLAEKEDFWRIYAAEAYSCGLQFAFHLRTVIPSEPTATDSGILSFLADYSRFYQQNAGLYRNVTNTGISASTGAKTNIACNLTYQPDKDRYILHLVNHNYNNQIMPQSAFTVSLNLDRSPTNITLISPDTNITQNLSFTKAGSLLQINVDNIDFYDVLIIE